LFYSPPLTEDEVRIFLAAADSKLNIHLGTVDAKGEPNIHPTWYYFDVTNDRFYIETSKKSMKTENLNRNNTVYYCVDDRLLSGLLWPSISRSFQLDLVWQRMSSLFIAV
jgi:nitroimidazol reductase NimA-like FMN-containing flavoprotein (pyridoxamine 5'-phosphate oxidase superfamily)